MQKFQVKDNNYVSEPPGGPILCRRLSTHLKYLTHPDEDCPPE